MTVDLNGRTLSQLKYALHMRFLVLLAGLTLFGGCSASDPIAEENELFGRWWPSSPRFGGLIVSIPETGSDGRTETEYLFQLNYVVKLDQTEDLVTVDFTQALEGPRTDYVYNKDGTLAVRRTSNIKTMEGATSSHLYSGEVAADGTSSGLLNGDGRGLTVSFVDGKLRLEFENYTGLFHDLTRSFNDYASGSAEPTSFVAHFFSDPYVVELDYVRD